MTSSSGDYTVAIGSGTFEVAISRADVVLVDPAVGSHVAGLDVPVVAVEGDESTKTMAGCERVVIRLRELGVRRGDHLVAVGGGVVQDVGTFVSDIYMRGLPWSYVPTTLMAMADSCIGGKSSINVAGVKNLVGGIYPPHGVYVDPRFLDSLGPGAIAAGFGEASKICYCRGPEAFDRYLELFGAFEADPAALIEHVLRAKRWFVQIDEYDRAERRLLNFGHTFGHALESAVDHAVPHGLAVAIGVMIACAHPLAADRSVTAALTDHCRLLLASAPGVVGALARFDLAAYERAFLSDKKHSAGELHLVLPLEGGGVSEVRVPSDTAQRKTVREVTQWVLDQLRSEL